MSRITERLQIKYPLIQAPMAGGITTSDLVVAVSNHGALGMIGAGYMNAIALQKQIKQIKQRTTEAFGVNVFVPGAIEGDSKTLSTSKELLHPYYERYHLQMEDISLPTEKELNDNYKQQLECIIEEKVSICSFTFGVPSPETIKQLHEHDVMVIGTATTVKEAMLIEELGMDAVVLQGAEAGGHRGNFLADPLDSQIGLMALIPQVADRISIPIIAAGGIMDQRGLHAALCLGADAVQMGTAFVLTKESGAHPLHKESIIEASGDDTVLTNVFSGKYARGIRNDFIDEMNQKNSALPTYPIQNVLTQPLRKAAKAENDSGLMSLWSGQGASLGRKQTVKELIQELMENNASNY